MRSLPRVDDARLLVGSDTADDAAVYRLTDEFGRQVVGVIVAGKARAITLP